MTDAGGYGAAVLDVRLILDGKVWPRDVHDFGGDVVDILDEQLAEADTATRVDAAQQLLELLREPDQVIRGFAVLAIRRAATILGEPTVRAALDEHREWLTVTPPPMWQISHSSLLEEAEYRLRFA